MIERAGIDYDYTLAQNQWRFRVYALRQPWFWQNDGHHQHSQRYCPDAA
jgi:hypothetical protein